ncbi:MAG: hypothetical protein QXF74_04925 [Nitrososphaerota archaeon]
MIRRLGQDSTRNIKEGECGHECAEDVVKANMAEAQKQNRNLIA